MFYRVEQYFILLSEFTVREVLASFGGNAAPGANRGEAPLLQYVFCNDWVNLTNLRHSVYYRLNEALSIGASPNIIANWEHEDDNRFTVWVDLGINKGFQFAKVAMRIGFEVCRSVIKPDDVPGPEWDFPLFSYPCSTISPVQLYAMNTPRLSWRISALIYLGSSCNPTKLVMGIYFLSFAY